MSRSLRASSAVVVLVLAAVGLSTHEPPYRPPCTPESGFQYVASGVKYYDCNYKYPEVHIVAVDRTLPAMEIQLLMDRRSDDPGDGARLKTVQDLAAQAKAVVAINGQNWRGNKGIRGQEGDLVEFDTTVYTHSEKRSSNSKAGGNEQLMGFQPGGALGLEAKRIWGSEVETTENIPYQYQMYGSDTSVLKDGACTDFDMTATVSIVGYSEKEIIFLSGAHNAAHSYRQQDLCPLLGLFNVTNAVRQDAGPSAGLYVGGSVNRHVNPLTRIDWLAFGSARRIAYAVGLVPITPTPTATESIGTAAPTGPISCRATSDGLRYRTCPKTSSDCPALGQYAVGTMISFVCKVAGESIEGNGYWGKNTAGTYVSLFYVDRDCAGREDFPNPPPLLTTSKGGKSTQN